MLSGEWGWLCFSPNTDEPEENGAFSWCNVHDPYLDSCLEHWVIHPDKTHTSNNQSLIATNEFDNLFVGFRSWRPTQSLIIFDLSFFFFKAPGPLKTCDPTWSIFSEGHFQKFICFCHCLFKSFKQNFTQTLLLNEFHLKKRSDKKLNYENHYQCQKKLHLIQTR